MALKKPSDGAEEKNPLISIEMQSDKLHNNETKGLTIENIQTGSLFCRYSYSSSVSGILVKELLWIK